MTKELKDYFADWEAHVFGYGYGSGELHTLGALKEFLAACPAEGAYDYESLECAVGPTVAWLLINTLCMANILDYGTSPRYAWLTAAGKRLKSFVDTHTIDEIARFTEKDEDYAGCGPSYCNCGPNGYEDGLVCQNPFWVDQLQKEPE